MSTTVCGSHLTSRSDELPCLVFASHHLFHSMFGRVDKIDLEQLHYIHEDVNSDVNPKF